jgi:predicted PurR-regulated permease PerM
MYAGKQFNESIKQIGIIIVIVFLFCLIVAELRYFASSLLGGFTLYMILRKPHRWMLKKGWNKTLATSVLLLITCLFLFLIVGGLISLIYIKLRQFNPHVIINSLTNIHGWLMQEWEYNIFSEEVIQKAATAVGDILPGILSATGNVVANVLMMVFVLFFMLYQSDQFESGAENLLPLSKKNITVLKKETNNMVIGNAVGIPVIMLGQGFTAGLAYWFFDAGDPIIWGLLTGVFGLIPVIGTAGIWLPLSINLIIGGNTWQGIVLIVYGACIIASVDNVFRMVFMKKQANVHPLITIFGIILGMNLFGFWGIIFGPLILSGFFLLIKMYKDEFLIA